MESSGGKRRVLRRLPRLTAGRIGVVLVALMGLIGALVAMPSISRADNGGGCDFAPIGSLPSCSPPLTGSTFQGGDGNLLATGTGNTDWSNVAKLNSGFDLQSGSGDNSFGQGTKEDNANVTVVSGSIPPNKSDLTRFYETSSTATLNSVLHNYVDLAWERSNVLGSANMDFEINQNIQPDLTTPGAKVLSRQPGDLLVTYDFNNGGGRPTIGLLRWVTGAHVPVVPNVATNSCFSANSFPCWGDQKTLDGSDSIGAVNNLDPVTDLIAPTGANYKNPVPALQFGETSIDLTAAGVFTPGTCLGFGSALVTSRSSASFTAEIKDFISPIPVDISNCSNITVIKHTAPRGATADFNFSLKDGNGVQIAPFTLNDTHGAGTGNPDLLCSGTNAPCDKQVFSDVPNGSYTVTETEPSGYALKNVECSADGTSSAGQHGTDPQADITLQTQGDVVCTFTNQALGEITIVKNTSPRGIDQSFLFTSDIPGTGNDSFGLNDAAGNTQSTTDTRNMTGWAPGTYTVTETGVSGWTLASISCPNNGTGGTTTTSTGVASIVLTPGAHVTCTYTNNQPTGAIVITKSGKDKNCTSASVTITNGVCTSTTSVAHLNGATFSVTGTDLLGGAVTKSVSTTVNGTVCVDGLPWNGTGGNSYTVTETGNPAGFGADATPQTITVSKNAKCTDNPLLNAAAGTFTDTPLTSISVNATAQSSGATNSTISCTDGSKTVGGTVASTTPDPVNYSATGLAPGTYTCTVVVDP
jgi:hypothetical protein